MPTEPDKPELLAPAGTMEAGLAAFDAGADAVYAGLSRFNARERGQNFTMEALRKLIAYAHKHRRKVYVTLNTLIKDSELIEAAEVVAELAIFRPDAILVQDLGMVRLIREFFPALEVHASTQMGIHNSAGARTAERLGIRRIILERQVPLEEIAEIRRNTSIELEAFVHGALCCSRSGHCLFSSWMGGWSGNRGKCKQPCRRRYYSPEGNGFFFSTRDLYGLEAIAELRRIGVRSLKIEGRLRRADYVSRVVSAYRMMLDVDEDSAGKALKAARAVLAGAPGRKWKPVFRSAADFDDVIQHTAMGASGLLCGKVVNASETGFLVKLSRTLRINDTVRIQPDTGDEGPAMTITRMSVDRKNVMRAGKGQQCWIHFDRPVATRSTVYKTGVEPPDLSGRIAELPMARPAIDLDICFSSGLVEVQARINGGIVAGQSGKAEIFTRPVELTEAKSRPLIPAKVEEEFRKTRSQTLSAGKIRVTLPEGSFLPASKLKEVRRAFWEWAGKEIDPEVVQSAWRGQLALIKNDLEACVTAGKAIDTITVCLPETKNAGQNPIPGALIAQPVSHYNKSADEAILPEFCPEAELPELKKQVADAVVKGASRFRVTSLYGFDLLKDFKGLQATASFPIPVCNRLAVRELISIGATKATAWVELGSDELQDLLNAYASALEVFTYGRIPLLSTRFKVPVSGEITDGRGARFSIIEEGGLAWLFPEKVLALPAPPGVSTLIDLTHADPNESATDSFNYFRELV